MLEEQIISKPFRHLNCTCIYKVRYSVDHIKKLKREAVHEFDYDLYDSWLLYVTDFGISPGGSIFLVLSREDEMPNSVWDCIEINEVNNENS